MLALAVDIGLARLGYGLVLPGIRADIAGSFAAFGAVATAHFAGYLGGSLLTPVLLRRDRSARTTATLAQIGVGLSLFVCAFASDIIQLGVLRAVLGFGCGVGVATVVTGALERVRPSARASISGSAWAGIGVAVLLSAPVTPWLLDGQTHWRFGTALAGVLAVLVALGINRAFRNPVVSGETETLRETPFRIADLLQPDRYLFLALTYFAFGAAYTAYTTFIVAAFHALRFSTASIALMWCVFGVATIVGALNVGKIVGRYSRVAFSFSMLLAAFGSLIATVPTFLAATAGAAGVGLGLASSAAIASALARARSSASTGAAAFVAITTFMSVGQIIGPVAAGAAADAYGLAAVAWLAFAIYAVGALLGWIDGRLNARSSCVVRSHE
jgi:predicted MFS family arabinose efflux permease